MGPILKRAAVDSKIEITCISVANGVMNKPMNQLQFFILHGYCNRDYTVHVEWQCTKGNKGKRFEIIYLHLAIFAHMYSPSADEYKSTLFWVILGITLFWGWFHSKLQSIGLNWLLSNFESVFHYFEHVFPLYIIAISDIAPKRMQFHSCTLQTVHFWSKETWATTRLPNSGLFMF